MTSPITWTHSDPRGLQTAVQQGIARASALAWDTDASPASTGSRAADLRALLAATYFTASQFWPNESDKPQLQGESGVAVRSEPADGTYTDPIVIERIRVGATLEKTWAVLAQAQSALSPSTTPAPRSLSTNGDAILSSEAGFVQLIIGGVIAIAGIAAGAAVAVYCAQKAAEIIDAQLARAEDTKRYIADHTATLQAMQQHIQREATEKKTLPLSDVEKQVLGNLEQHQQTILNRQSPPIPSPLPSAAGVGAAASSLAAPLIAGGVLAYFLFRN